MKLELDGIIMPYSGGCTVERNYPFFEDSGLENSYSYSFKIPIFPASQSFFHYAERVNSHSYYTTKTFKVRLSHLGIVYVEGIGELQGISETDYEIYVSDEGSSIYGQLKKIKLSDLDLDSFTFADKAAYLSFVKERIFENMKDSVLIYPLMAQPDFFKDVEIDTEGEFTEAMEKWDAYPLLNSWTGRYSASSDFERPHTTLFPCISVQYIISKIYENLGEVIEYNAQALDVILPDHMNGKTATEIFETGAYITNENGSITVNVVDFMPDMTALDFFMLTMEKACVFQLNRNTITYKADVLSLPLNDFDISPYVIEVDQTFIKPIDGWALMKSDDSLWTGSYYNTPELKVTIDYPTIKSVRVLEPREVVTGSNIFRSIEDYILKNSYKDVIHSIVYNHTDELHYLVDSSQDRQTWTNYMHWKVEGKRQITVKCIPSNLLLTTNTFRIGCIYKNCKFFIKQVRYEMLEDKIGFVTYILVQA